MPATTPTAAEVAWHRLRDLLADQRRRFMDVAAELDLSPPQLFALLALDPEVPAPMRRLAVELRCDASNVTGIVDRLESRDLVERRPAEHDRRVKELVLTQTGRALRERLSGKLDAPPAWLEALDLEDQRLLGELLRKAAEHDA